MENEKLAKIISLDEYRDRNKPRYSDEDMELLSHFKGSDPASKEHAKEKIREDPSLVARMIEDRLANTGYPQESIDRVERFLQETKDGYPDASASEISDRIRHIFRLQMESTYQELGAGLTWDEDSKAKTGGVVLDIMRNAEEVSST